MYTPTVGRWLQRDPKGYVDGANLYEYVQSSPARNVDPTGTGPAAPWAGNTHFGPYAPPTGPWTWGDFLHHYLGELTIPAGTAIDLGNVGLLDTFKNAPSVRQAVTEFEESVRSQAVARRHSLDCGKNNKVTFNVTNNTVTDVTKEIFVVGHSTFFRSAVVTVVASNCVCCEGHQYPTEYAYEATVSFSIRDRFADPADMQQIIGRPVEHPGGTPFPINAAWTTTVRGHGKLPVPCF